MEGGLGGAVLDGWYSAGGRPLGMVEGSKVRRYVYLSPTYTLVLSTYCVDWVQM